MPCLTPEQVESLARDALAPAEAAELRRHVEQCKTCRSKLDECLVNEEALQKLKRTPVPVAANETDGSTVTDETASVGRISPGRSAAPAEPPPDSFPGYEIIREVHRGGQGVVYQAVQKSTWRKVAIKVMKEGPFLGRADKARFDREVHVLGQLKHPNIVAIHDTGVAAGTHFFVMDYISGQALDVYSAGAERSVEDTLRLFAKICDAVNAAHLHGVIHRDLKPGNIRIDAEGEPYILDFGLAKTATGAAEASLMTMTGQFLGSLPWASPEQAEAIPGKIDLRTDVYSLGVILYQMLTGTFPYEVVGNMRDVLDSILNAEPAKPSTVRKQVNDEVETIVLKCLSKDRDRRYQTAGELSRDIGRYLAGEPIEAKRESAMYVLRKTLRRYKVPVAIGTAFVLLLGVGLVTTAVLYAYAIEQRHDAQSARDVARSEAEKAQAVNRVLLGALQQMDPEVARRGLETPFAEFLGKVSIAVRSELHDHSEEAVELYRVIGCVYASLGQTKRAEAELNEALELARATYGPSSLQEAVILRALGAYLHWESGEYPLSRQYLEQSYAILQAHSPTPSVMKADLLTDLAWIELEIGNPTRAGELARDSLAMKQAIPDLPELALTNTLLMMGNVALHEHRFADAEDAFRRVLEIDRRDLDEGHWWIANAESYLAEALVGLGRFEEAQVLILHSHPIIAAAAGNSDYSTRLSVERAIALYRAWHAAEPDKGYSARAAEWQAVLEAASKPGTGDEDVAKTNSDAHIRIGE